MTRGGRNISAGKETDITKRQDLRGILVRRNPWFGAATLLLLLVSTLAAFAVPFANGSEQGTPEAIAGYGFFFFFVALSCWLGFYRAPRHGVALGLQNGLLTVDGRVQARFGRGVAATLNDGRARLDLWAFPRRVRLELDDMQTARDMLGALGLDRRSGSSRFSVTVFRASMLMTGVGLFEAALLITGFFAFVFGVVGPSILGIGVVVLALGAILERLGRHVELTIGADGVEMHRRWRRRVFLPYARIRSVERIDRRGERWFAGDENVSAGLAITLDDGSRVSFDTRDERFRANVWETDPIADGIRRARESAKASGPTRTAAAALARRDRDAKAWIGELRALAKHERADYRVAALDAASLFELLSDANASRELRAAAAIALAATPEHAPKLRVAADDVADDVVRRVAVAALEEDEAAVEQAADAATEQRRRAR